MKISLDLIHPPCLYSPTLASTTKVRDAQCSYGCVENAGAEIVAMAQYDTTMRLYTNNNGGSKTPLAESANR